LDNKCEAILHKTQESALEE